jgi:hypothetical protein
MQANNPTGLSDLRGIITLLQQWFQVLTTKVGFGSFIGGTFQPDNIDGQIIQFTFTGSNTQKAIPHNLGRVPTGYIVIGTTVACNVYQLSNTGTAWTSTTIYLSCTAINTVMLFVF